MIKKLLVVPVLILLLAIFGSIWWRNVTSAPSRSKEEAKVVISKGASASQIATKLKEGGVIKNAFSFRLYTQITGQTKDIPSGEFFISKNLNLKEVVEVLLKGPAEFWVTIPEGLRREEIALKISSVLKSGQEAGEFEKEFLRLTSGFEGYLFPDTYLFPKDVTADRVFSVLNSTFESRFGELTRDQVILASLIERETITDEERPIVAGILLNRFNAKWPLQVDATVQYALGRSPDWWEPITRADLETSSPYNTYKYTGFPPGPISNPGRSSLEAAANPESTDYWYYIHDTEGKIHYAKTLDEHNANVSKYLR